MFARVAALTFGLAMLSASGAALSQETGAAPVPAVARVGATSPQTWVAQAEQRGLALHRADRAAWLTSDQLSSQVKIRQIPGKPVGWVTTRESDTLWHVAYVTRKRGDYFSFADGTVDFSAEQPLASLRANQTLRPLRADESIQIKLRDEIMKRRWLACDGAYNTSVLARADGWDVYLMPPQRSRKAFPMGGFHRFHFSADGQFIEHYAQTKTCLSQDFSGLADVSSLEGLVVGHLTSPRPTELHVFMNLAYALPVYVAVNDGTLWNIAGGKILAVAKEEAEAP